MDGDDDAGPNHSQGRNPSSGPYTEPANEQRTSVIFQSPQHLTDIMQVVIRACVLTVAALQSVKNEEETAGTKLTNSLSSHDLRLVPDCSLVA